MKINDLRQAPPVQLHKSLASAGGVRADCDRALGGGSSGWKVSDSL